MNKPKSFSAYEELEIPAAFKEWFDKCHNLYSNKQYLEAFLVLSTIIEAQMKILISLHELSLELKTNKFRPATVRRKLSKMTMGELISWLSVYCNDDQLLTKLKNFSEMRNQHIHHLLHKSPESINNFLKSKEQQDIQLTQDLNDKMEPLALKTRAAMTRIIEAKRLRPHQPNPPSI